MKRHLSNSQVESVLKTPLSTWDGPGGAHTCARAWKELPQHFKAGWSPVVTAARRELSREPTGGGWEDSGRGFCLFLCSPTSSPLPSQPMEGQPRAGIWARPLIPGSEGNRELQLKGDLWDVSPLSLTSSSWGKERCLLEMNEWRVSLPRLWAADHQGSSAWGLGPPRQDALCF